MSRKVVKSEIDDFETDKQTEIKQEYVQTSQNISLESARPELEQNHDPLAIDQIFVEAMLDPTDHPALTDCQPTLSSIINQLFEISDESIKEQEIAPNGDVAHLTSAVSFGTMDNGCEISTTDNFHATSEEVHVSDLSRAIMTTDQASDNGNTQSSQQNEIHTAVDLNASNDLIATATTSNPPIAHQMPLLDDEPPLRLRLRERKQINYCDGDSKSRAHDSKKDSHYECNESKVKGNSRPKVRPQLKIKCEIGNLRANVGARLAVAGETHHKCKQCQYATNSKSQFTEHMRKYLSTLIQHERIHTGERPYKCQFCKYATARHGNLTEHIRIHTGEKSFKCRFCKFATVQSSHLIQHTRIHTGEKPYKCRFCQFASGHSESLKRHVRTQHKNALKVHAAISKKNAKRDLLNKSAKND